MILIVAAALRVQYAETRRVLWRDEIFEIQIGAETESIAESMRLVRDDRWTPLSYLVTRAVDHTFGREFLLGRWHVLTFGWLTVLSLMLLARRWFGSACALLCGVFAATSPFLIHYSAEIRAYALYCLLTVVYFGVYFEFRERRTWRWAIGWGVAATLIAYCHYFGLFFILVSGVLALLDRPFRRSFGHAVIGGAAFLICFSPWMPALRDAMSSGGQHWVRGDVKFDRVFLPAKILLGEKGKWLIWGGIALGGIAAARGRFTPHERRIFLALPIIIVGSAIIGWLVQTQSERAFIGRYLIGHVVILIPAGLFYWARVGTLGSVAFWRGLQSGRIYTIDARVVGALGLALLGWAWITNLEDRDGWVRNRLTPHGEARAVIAEQFQEGDLILAGSGFTAEGFAYNCAGLFDVLVVPHHDDEASTRGRVHVSPRELARRNAEVELRIEQSLLAGNRVWYYFPVSIRTYPIDGVGEIHRTPRRLSKYERVLRLRHLRFLCVMDQYGERTTFQSWTKGYLHQFRLIRYRALAKQVATVPKETRARRAQLRPGGD